MGQSTSHSVELEQRQAHSVELQQRDAIVSHLMSEALHRVELFRAAAEAEKAAGLPAAPRSSQALYDAAHAHLFQLIRESNAIDDHLGGFRRCAGHLLLPARLASSLG